jgi:hypothetical protein
MSIQFSWLNKQGVRSDEGIVLQRVDRYAFEYREANRTMRLEGESIVAELGSCSWGFGFYPNWRNATWMPPFETVPISDQDRKRIVQNIKEAAAFMGGKVEF